jgi:hypothetical protein
MAISNELQEARTKLAAREAAQQRMKDVNALIRKHKGNADTITPELLKMGIDEQEAHKLLNPKYSYESKGYQGWQLTNNSSEVRRLKDRVKMLEGKEQQREAIAATDGAQQPEETINGVRIVHNYEADRVQMFFDGKPPADIRAELNGNGFNWTPSILAWQRKLNNIAIYQAARIAGKVTPPAPPTPARDEAQEAQGVDLFEDYDQQPEELRAVIEEYREQLESEDYPQLEQALKALNAIGYTFEYYLDATPYDLRKIGQSGKVQIARNYHRHRAKSPTRLYRLADDGFMSRNATGAGYVPRLCYFPPRTNHFLTF